VELLPRAVRINTAAVMEKPQIWIPQMDANASVMMQVLQMHGLERRVIFPLHVLSKTVTSTDPQQTRTKLMAAHAHAMTVGLAISVLFLLCATQRKIAMRMVLPRISTAQMDVCAIALLVGLATVAQSHLLVVHRQTVPVMEPQRIWTRPTVAFACAMDVALRMLGLHMIARCHLHATKTLIAVVTVTRKTWTRRMVAGASAMTSTLVRIVRCRRHVMLMSIAADMV